MPIKPENLARYPANWKTEVRPRILDRARHRCERCGLRNGIVGAWIDGQWFDAMPEEKLLRLVFPEPGTISTVVCRGVTDLARIVRVVLTIAHTHDPDPANCADENLQALCQRCHNRLDAPMRQANAAKTRHDRKAAGDLFAITEEVP